MKKKDTTICGGCPFFKYEDSNGVGICDLSDNIANCYDKCGICASEVISDIGAEKVLHVFQKWRRGANIPMLPPKLIGIAIDRSIHTFRKLRNKGNAEREIWKPIKERPDYQVSNFGNVRRRTERGEYKKIKPYKTSRYMCIGFQKDGNVRRHLVHRLVAEAFVPNPYNDWTVRHIDGDLSNNKYTNLKWIRRYKK